MKTRTIYKSDGKVELDKHTKIYGLDKSSGRIEKADLMPLDKSNTFRLIEKKDFIYLPASSMEIAEATFKTIFTAAKNGNIKLSFKEWVAKWWTVLTIKWNRLCRK